MTEGRSNQLKSKLTLNAYGGICIGVSCVHLEKFCAKLWNFTGQVIPVIGIMSVDMKYQQQLVKHLNLDIVREHDPNLLGRDWLSVLSLDWKFIGNLKLLQDSTAPQKH